jgi:hypothetical protein
MRFDEFKNKLKSETMKERERERNEGKTYLGSPWWKLKGTSNGTTSGG